MANTPSAIKRVRTSARRRAINQPRRSAAKTLVAKAVATAGGGNAESTQEALVQAVSALDRAAKVGAIHRNAAARRKSRLMLKINALLGGEAITGAAKPTRSTGKAAAAKATRTRIAASRATKASGEQTAAGKARAALSRATRETAPAATAPGTSAAQKGTGGGAPAKGGRPRGGATAATKTGGNTRRTTKAGGAPDTSAAADAPATEAKTPRRRGILGRGGDASPASGDAGSGDAPKPRRTTKKTS